ncbi:MAG: hypothetical protein KAI24_15985, partial [Planctomycetes bacterium]|nr:hypothetical protein [Planctomycetota bacterium]
RTSRTAQPPFAFALSRDAERCHVEARRAVAGAAAPQLRLADGDPVQLHEVAPGVFRGARVAPLGADLLLVAGDGGGWRHLLCSAGLDAEVAETQVDPRRAMPLAEIAAFTDGAFVAPGAAVPALSLRRSGVPMKVVPLWPWLVLLSLLLYLFDVYDRRGGRDARRLA